MSKMCMDCKHFAPTKKDRYGKPYIFGGECKHSPDKNGKYSNGGCDACNLLEPKEEVKNDVTE